MYKAFAALLCAALFAACSSAPRQDHTDASVRVSGVRVDLSDTQKVKQVLNQQYKEWNHVQHRMGGTSKKGIDCSGFVYQTYRTRLGVDVPRSTESQSKTGSAVKQKQLRAGDLVFFKTGVFSRHVGMYIDKGDFLHVSTRKGVMISNLEETYWRSAYWKARRIQ
ncbi:MAG: C40 family peptidase [Thiotrichales bacterium]|nr:MAG: C40 family peptidase [Thiotrichales bacterium]